MQLWFDPGLRFCTGFRGVTRLFASFVTAGVLLSISGLSTASQLELDGHSGSYSLAPCLEVLEDPSGTYRLEDIVSAGLASRFHPAAGTGDVNLGYSSSAFWLRCTISAAAAGEWLLEIEYPSLDHVQLFTPDPKGGYRVDESGDQLPFSARIYPHRNFVFPVEVGKGTTTIFLRIRSEGTLTIPATLWKPYALHQHDMDVYSILAVYYGIIIALGMYNLLLFISLRDRVYLEYVLFVTSMAVGQASLNGIGNQYFWPQLQVWGNVALPVGFSLCGLFGAMFTRSFMNMPVLAPRLNRVNTWFMVLFAISALFSLFIYRLGAMLTSLFGLSFSIFACGVGLYFFSKMHLIVRYFLLAWVLLLIGVGAMGARNFGWVPTNFFTMYGMQIGSALEMLLLSFALADRIQTLRNEKDLAQAEAISARQNLVDTLRNNEKILEARIDVRTRQLADAKKMLEVSLQQEKEGRETKANLLALMAHEIRSPVAVIGNTAQMLNALARTEHSNWQPRIEKIIASVRDLAKLIDNFLAEERLSAVTSGIDQYAGNLNEFCAQLAMELAASHQRNIRFEPHDGSTSIHADWQLVGIAIRNLIDNAIKYSTADSEIRLNVMSGKADTLCIEVSNQGEEIAPEDQQRIFEKFMRGEHANGVRGTGLGLYLVNWIARIHHGYVEVASGRDGTNTFRCCLNAGKQERGSGSI